MTGRHPADMPGFEPGSVLAGYRLEARVGEGGMAVVYRARDERLHRLVALKILAPEYTADAAFRLRFIRESEAAAAVDHPHIIPIYLAGDAGGVLFIAMRFVSGGDLRQVMEREGPLPPARVGEIISPVASALDAAHIAGLVHRDVKPANLLVDTGPGRPDHMLLSDFGISKSVTTTGTLTGTGQFIGTAGYSAPEQIEERSVDGRADQYALACVTYELLTGETLFQRQSIYGVLIAHVHEQAPLLTSRRPDLPSAADGVLARALAKSPGERYPSCADFADALREAFGLPPYHAGRAVLRPGQDQPPAKPSEPSGTDRPGTEAPEIPSDSEALTVTVTRTAVITQPPESRAGAPETRAGTGLVPVRGEAAPILPRPVGVPSATAPAEPAEAAEAPPEPEADAAPEPEAAEADAASEHEAAPSTEAVAEPEVAGDAEAAVAPEPEVDQANEAAAEPAAVAEPEAAGEPEAVGEPEAAEAATTPGTEAAWDAEAVAVAGAEPVAEPQVVAEAEAIEEAAELDESVVPLDAEPLAQGELPDADTAAGADAHAPWLRIPDMLDDDTPADPPADAGSLSTPTSWAALAGDPALTAPIDRELADTDEFPAVELGSAAGSRAADGRESIAAPGPVAEPAPGASPGPETVVPGPASVGQPPPGAARDWRRRLPIVAVSAIVVGAAVTIPFMLKSPASTAHPQHSTSPRAPVTAPRATRIPLPASLSHIAISSVAFNPSGSALAIAGQSGTCLMDVATHNCTGNVASAVSVAYNPDGTILASGDTNNSVVQLWSAATGRQILPALSDPDSDGVLSVAYSPNGKTVADGDQNGNTYLWDVAAKNPTPLALPDPGSKGVNAVAYSPNGTALAAADGNGKTYLWNVATRRLIAELPDTDSDGVWSVAFSPDGKMLATGDGNGRSYVWNVATKKLITSFSDKDGQGVRSLAFSPNSAVLATGDHNGNTYLWSIRSKTLITSLSSTHDHGVDTVAFSRDGRTLITGNEDGTVDSWPVSTLTGGY